MRGMIKSQLNQFVVNGQIKGKAPRREEGRVMGAQMPHSFLGGTSLAEASDSPENDA